MNRTNKTLGSIFIIFGILFLLKNLHIIDFGFLNFGYIIAKFWPLLFLILPGALFHFGFFAGRNRDPGLLVPGGILLVLGAAFQINMLFGGWDIMWPVYIFSVAFGLFELYIFGNRDRGLLIPVGILTGLSAIFFAAFSLNRLFSFNTKPYIMPVILVAIGFLVLYGGKNGRGGQGRS